MAPAILRCPEDVPVSVILSGGPEGRSRRISMRAANEILRLRSSLARSAQDDEYSSGSTRRVVCACAGNFVGFHSSHMLIGAFTKQRRF